MQINRLFEIVYILLHQKMVTAKELAARFEVSERTIYRDVETLSGAGIPIYTNKGKGGGIGLLDQFVLNKSLLSEQEQEEILYGLQSLQAASYPDGGDVLPKLRDLFCKEDSDWIEVDFSDWGSLPGDNPFALLKRAVLEKRRVRFLYSSSYGRRSERLVEPLKLQFKARTWYLQGYCTQKEGFRTFRLSRMEEVAVTDERFERDRKGLPPVDTDGTVSCPMQTLRLRFAPQAGFRVLDEFPGRQVTRREDGGCTVICSMPVSDWLFGYLLSFGTSVQVLDPPFVRRELFRRAKKIAGLYEEVCKYDTQLSDLQWYTTIKETPKTKGATNMKDQRFCQSCGMPLGETDEMNGTNTDGTKNEDYCSYCYQNGAFAQECTMEEMIDFCAGPMVESNPNMTAEQAKQMMQGFFPMLGRWKQN